MGLFSFLLGSRRPEAINAARREVTNAEPTSPSIAGTPTVRWRPDSYPMEVVGELNYQDALVAICGVHTRYGHEGEYSATLLREPSNAFDSNAVAVLIQPRKVGYLSREQAERVAVQMDEAGLKTVYCAARIRGGWRTNQHDQGHYGVRLAVPTWGWIDLGIGGEKPVKPREPRKASTIPAPAAKGPLSGERIAIQGEPSDGPLAAELAAAGARITSGPGKTTTLFIVAASRPFTFGHIRSATHSKAIELGISILSVDEIRERIRAATD